MAKVLAIGGEDACELHLLLPSAVVAVHHSRDAGVMLTLLSGRELLTTCSMETVTNWLGWTGDKRDEEAP